MWRVMLQCCRQHPPGQLRQRRRSHPLVQALGQASARVTRRGAKMFRKQALRACRGGAGCGELRRQGRQSTAQRQEQQPAAEPPPSAAHVGAEGVAARQAQVNGGQQQGGGHHSRACG